MLSLIVHLSQLQVSGYKPDPPKSLGSDKSNIILLQIYSTTTLIVMIYLMHPYTLANIQKDEDRSWSCIKWAK